MASLESYERLSLLFRRSALLPQLPGSAAHLLQLTKTEEDCNTSIERIVTSDPALAASILRIASSAVYGREKVKTIRGAILRIGRRPIKSLALSLAMQSMASGIPNAARFDPFRHSRHALFTGMMASTLHAEAATTLGNMEWESEEVLAVGILHDLHYGVLARIAPDCYRLVLEHAKNGGLSLDQAFEQTMGQPAWPLAVSMFEAWGMPTLFAESLRLFHRPEIDDSGIRSFGALKVAHRLATDSGFGVEDWEVKANPDFGVWPLPPAEALEQFKQMVLNEAEAYLQTTLAVAA